MKIFKILMIICCASLALSSCKQHQEARRPVSQASGSFMKESVARNKKLVKGEEAQIDSIIKSDPSIKYIPSKKGYWYHYVTRNAVDTLTAKKGDIAFFDYELKDLNGHIIYSELELRPQVYKIDKQEIMMGLRDGLKLMRKNEKVNFLFTSHMGYGFHGDNNKIGPNQPLLCTVTLRDFMPEAVYKKQNESLPVAKTQPVLKAEPVIKPDTTKKIETTKNTETAKKTEPIKKPQTITKDTLKIKK